MGRMTVGVTYIAAMRVLMALRHMARKIGLTQCRESKLLSSIICNRRSLPLTSRDNFRIFLFSVLNLVKLYCWKGDNFSNLGLLNLCRVHHQVRSSGLCFGVAVCSAC